MGDGPADPISMQFEFAYEADDIKGIDRIGRRSSRWRLWTSLILGGLFIGALCIATWKHPLVPATPVINMGKLNWIDVGLLSLPWLVIAWFVVFLVMGLFRGRARAWGKIVGIPLTLRIDEEGVQLGDASGFGRRPWHAFVGWTEIENAMLLVLRVKRTYIIIPKRIMTAAQQAELRTIFDSRTQPETRGFPVAPTKASQG